MQASERHGRPVFAPSPTRHPRADSVGVDDQPSQQGRADGVDLRGPVLLRTKLRPPPVRAGLIPRARLDKLLEAGSKGRLCLLDAPAGSGKTTLLAQWCLTDQASRRVAWVSLDENDDDPVRFWVYIIEAFRVLQPSFGDAPLGLLQGAGSADVLTQVVLPQLLNELATGDAELVLLLDDYHLISSSTCHQTLGFFIDRLPANVHVVLSTRVDPPLPLARLRASGELTELRIADLGFTDTEAASLFQDAMGLDLTPQAVRRLWERTEGWAAGLILAGLSLRGRANPEPFIASFEAGHRHVVDYLGSEVLASQPEPLRTFMVRTSMLQRLSAPLCDAVLEADDSARVLAELEQANLFLIALDDHRQWYRYHHLFGQLLGLELAEQEPELVPALHRRAAAWYRDAGDVEAAIHHATAAGEFAEAGALIARHWLSYARRGQIATVQRWLDRFPNDVITASPPMALLAAWVGGLCSGSLHELERWLAAAEASDYQGTLPPGMPSVPFAAAMVRAMNTFDHVGRSLRAARRALEAGGPRASESYWMAATALGRSLYLSGQAAEARVVLEDVVSHAPAPDRQPFVVVNALALLSLLEGEDGDDGRAMALARQAMDVAEAQGVRYDPMTGVAYIALAQSAARRGGLAEAEQLLDQALQVLGNDSYQVQYGQAVVEVAGVRHARGDADGARAALDEARRLITTFADPGMLGSLLDRTERALERPSSRRRPSAIEALTDRELVVLRLLATTLSQPEIAQELYVSVNTVRTHIQGIYRKLGVASRREAIAAAREQELLPDPVAPPHAATEPTRDR
jgi:LuxR family transcriptional regulator, maltose regulon positive regulatory protein